MWPDVSIPPPFGPRDVCSDIEFEIWGFPKTRGTCFEVLIIRILLFRVLYYSGPLFSATLISSVEMTSKIQIYSRGLVDDAEGARVTCVSGIQTLPKP